MRRGQEMVALLALRDETEASKTGELTRNPMWQQDAYRMIPRRAAAAAAATAPSSSSSLTSRS